MDILKWARPVDHGGGQVLVIDDVALLDLAEEDGITNGEAQIEALMHGVVPHRYLKNFWSFGFEEQVRLCAASVLICGCGGLGSIIIELLARCGVGLLRLADGDVFTESNLNRQLLCTPDRLGVSKSRAATDRVRGVNPFVSVQELPYEIDEEDAGEAMNGVDLVMDAIDNVEGRFVLEASARRLGIPFIHTAVAGWWGQISTFLPGSALNMTAIYGSIRTKGREEEAAGVPGPTPSILGSLAALEAMRILTGKEAAYSEKLLYFDGESGTFSVAPLRR
ncbi:MAG: HesA/MoeB/ThiF family protein [Desulfobacteraceae bacterium]|nr:HesA/MoeB/ThiF family protein [Desulfobacteraceae bacterium]